MLLFAFPSPVVLSPSPPPSGCLHYVDASLRRDRKNHSLVLHRAAARRVAWSLGLGAEKRLGLQKRRQSRSRLGQQESNTRKRLLRIVEATENISASWRQNKQRGRHWSKSMLRLMMRYTTVELQRLLLKSIWRHYARSGSDMSTRNDRQRQRLQRLGVLRQSWLRLAKKRNAYTCMTNPRQMSIQWRCRRRCRCTLDEAGDLLLSWNITICSRNASHWWQSGLDLRRRSRSCRHKLLLSKLISQTCARLKQELVAEVKSPRWKRDACIKI
mmetsp:Transcript_86837/g.153327  ORF Transcript_86837/g.153327 Transcript_86837/m.153327 type:complete len:271 (+) Transcript_86837:26-838(+)